MLHQIELTSTDFDWDPSKRSFADQEISTTTIRCNVVNPEDISSRPNLVISSIRCDGPAVGVTHDDIFVSVLVQIIMYQVSRLISYW